MRKKYFILLFILFMVSFAFASSKAKPLKIYIDHLPCDLDFIKTSITYVDYVTSSEVADVHIVFYKSNMANSGKKYTVEFTGKRKFHNLENTLDFRIFSDDTENAIREKTSKILQIGLSYFISHTSNYKNLSINYKVPTQKTIQKKSKEGWICGIDLGSYINGSSETLRLSSWNNINVKKVTELKRTQFYLGLNYNENRYKIDGEIAKYINKSYYGGFANIYAINNHFSWAFFINAQQASYENKRYGISLSPALEYNLFPYDQSAFKQLRFAFYVKPVYYDYFKKTIYNKTQEFLWQNKVSISYEFVKKWGSNETSITASHYVHDTSFNNFGLSNDTSINLFKGFNLNFSTHASRTHDQMYISGEGVSNEDIYLNIKAIKTSYSYWINVGISYTFGSIYSNVVNPRFGY